MISGSFAENDLQLGARQAEGLQPRSHRAPQEFDQSSYGLQALPFPPFSPLSPLFPPFPVFLRSDISSFWDRTKKKSDLGLRRRAISKTLEKVPDHFKRWDVKSDLKTSSDIILEQNDVRSQKI